MLRKHLAFRIGLVPELTRSLVKGVASIALAWAGFGAWALIGGTLGGALAAVPVYWILHPWRRDCASTARPRACWCRSAAISSW
jgi:membrane associated rhomboid family serine protease